MYRAEIPCDPRVAEVCKYSPDCHTSKHHLYPRALGKQGMATALEGGDVERAQLIKNFIKCPLNEIVSCRRVHDILDASPPQTLPSEDFMLRAIEESP